MPDQTITRIPLDQLDLDPDFNVRATESDAKTVQKYAESAEFLPPILVWKNPDHDPAAKLATRDNPHGNMPYKIVDGANRYNAFRLRAATSEQYKTIPCIVLDVDRVGAQSLGMTANLTSGLPLNLEQRDAAVLRFIALNSTLGDRETSRQLGVSHPTILRIKTVAELGKAGAKLFDQAAKDGLAVKKADAAMLHGVAELPAAHRRQALENVMLRGWTRANLRDARNVLSKKRGKDESQQSYDDRIRQAMAAKEKTAGGPNADKIVPALAAGLRQLADLQVIVTATNLLDAIELYTAWAEVGPTLAAQIEDARLAMKHAEMAHDFTSGNDDDKAAEDAA